MISWTASVQESCHGWQQNLVGLAGDLVDVSGMRLHPCDRAVSRAEPARRVDPTAVARCVWNLDLGCGL